MEKYRIQRDNGLEFGLYTLGDHMPNPHTGDRISAKQRIDEIIAELKKLGREDIVVIAGGVIPAQDYDFLYKAGVAAIFGPGTSVAKAACQILEILMDEE